jgi:hypothetical protein
LCKNFDATFWVSTKGHPNAMERMVRTPNKVHPPTLNTILHLAYVFQIRKRMAGAEIKPQSQRSQKRAEVPDAVFHMYLVHQCIDEQKRRWIAGVSTVEISK